MARLSYVALGMLAGFAIGTAVAVGHADPAEAEVEAAAAQANVELVKLQGAVNTTGMDPFDYLRMTGELPPLPHDPPLRLVANPPPSSALAECLIRAESRGNPNAVNPRSGAAGLGQFLSSTWRTTPQGRAGLSVFDPGANRAAVNWMISVGRAGEFSTLGLCR
jgi:hypothetical protein